MLNRDKKNSCEEWNLTIGEIVSPFGRVGEVKVKLETDFPERFAKLKSVSLRWNTGVCRVIEVEKARLHKTQVLLKLADINSIDDAETLRNTLVQIHPDDAIALPDNEYYIHELINCEVSTLEGRVLGRITDVMRGVANDVYVIGKGKEEILIPAIKDVIREVNLDIQKITISPTPGLIPEEQIKVEDAKES